MSYDPVFSHTSKFKGVIRFYSASYRQTCEIRVSLNTIVLESILNLKQEFIKTSNRRKLSIPLRHQAQGRTFVHWYHFPVFIWWNLSDSYKFKNFGINIQAKDQIYNEIEINVIFEINRYILLFYNLKAIFIGSILSSKQIRRTVNNKFNTLIITEYYFWIINRRNSIEHQIIVFLI